MNQDISGNGHLPNSNTAFSVESGICNPGYLMRSKNLVHLLASTEGWSLDRVIDWLFDEGQHVTEPTRFTDELCRALLDSGVPLYCLRIAFRTLHPLVAACAFTWIQGRNSTEFCLLHEDPQADNLSDAEFEQLISRENLDSITLQLKSPDGKSSIISIFTKTPHGFSDEDIAKFNMLAEFLSPVVNVIAIQRKTQALLDTYIGHRAGGKVLDGLIKRGDGETIDAVIWYSDLRDFTLLTETLTANEVLSMLNTYFEYVSAAVSRRGGEVLRFIGDAMLVVFPVEAHVDIGQACNLALDAAIDILHNLGILNKERQQQGKQEIRFGIGLHVGHVIYGNVGAPDRLDFTVMGAAVNRTARLEELTKEVGVPLLLSAEFTTNIKAVVRSMGIHAMRGVTEKLEVFTLPLPGKSGES